jgi:hypothetical protein
MAKRSKVLILLSLVMIGIVPSTGSPYLLPSFQIIEFMASQFAEARTLQITQLTKIIDLNQEIEKAFGESLSLMSPDNYRSEIAGQPDKRLIIRHGSKALKIINGEVIYHKEDIDFAFHFLMIAQDPKQLLKYLKTLGINIDMVSLTRFDGRIAYLIGDKGEGNPRLLVDKDSFLPLLLQYGNILFYASDFREVTTHMWYPHSIVYSFTGANIDDYLKEEYRIKDIIINPSFDVSLFDIPLIRARFSKSGPSQEQE